ncbi:mitochondrial genome maintenance MGM101-domain-containing protein [Obelidium mucronatum]|nr:mitochondrial genome maintenance MGM101-domain-containing protein [Obelidium mucronatum]
MNKVVCPEIFQMLCLRFTSTLATRAALHRPAAAVSASLPRVLGARCLASVPPTPSSQSTFGNQVAINNDHVSPVAPVAIDSVISVSFEGASQEPFPKEAAEILMAEINEDDVEIKPDGLLYLPEIKYRRILNRAFGPGGWAMVPRGPHTVTSKTLSREYALFCLGRFAAVARGEQDYFNAESGLATASEGVKSNALLRCCKDLGVASELWDPNFIREFKAKKCTQVWASYMGNPSKPIWKLSSRTLDAPYKEEGPFVAGGSGGGGSSGSSYNKWKK